MKNFLKKKYCFLLIIFTFITLFTFANETYTVLKGDTLYSISKKFSLSLAELRDANNLSENDIIKIGQKLIIPSKDNTSSKNNTKIYTIQKGDTLYSIAKKHGMDVNSLLTLNNLNSSDVIKVGQKIKINSNNDSGSKITEKSSTNTKQDIVIDFGNIPDTRSYGVTIESDPSTIWPVKNPKVTKVKGKVGGVQLSAQYNEPVTCVREGTVMYVGTYRGFGQFIFVQSKTGVIYAYSGLSKVSVKKSDYVIFGTELGTAGIDSMSGKPAIQFMVFQNGQPIDPEKAPRN